MLKFALAGNPNCGKTTLFNSLIGLTAHVGNWPGVTVDKKEGVYKKCAEPISIVDLPGIYSLSPYTPEEVISRSYILDEKPDCIINIVDATNLERNLYLTTQLLEIDVPIVIALNMMDAVERNGDRIDGKSLEKKIGLPVVCISALKGSGLGGLMERAYEICKMPRKGYTVLNGTPIMSVIGDCKIMLDRQNEDNALFHAIKLAELDEIEIAMHPEPAKAVEEFKKTFSDSMFGSDFEAIIADGRYKYISENFSTTVTKGVQNVNEKFSRSDKIDRALTHKIWGIPIFLAIMFLMFHLTFSEDFLFLGAFGVFDGEQQTVESVLEDDIIEDEPDIEEVESRSMIDEFCSGISLHTFFGYDEGVYAPGVILQNTLVTFTDFLSVCVSQGLASACAAEWVGGIIVDGVLGGLFSVLSFLPQILLLFLFFSILEDSGYMARVAFISDRIFRKFGLSGRAFMPMIMSFGCSIPAMINTRTLADKNERTATIRVIPFFSCGAKLPILTAIAGGIISLLGVGNADLIIYGMYLLGVIIAIASVLLMRNTTIKGETPPFIMELPSYHAPQFKNLMLHLWDKAKHFIKKAFTIILISTIVIWIVSHFSWNWSYLSDERMNDSILAGIGGLIRPLLTPLGFGSQLSSYGWVFAVAAVTGFIAKENVIATFGTLAACITSGFVANEALEGADSVAAMISATDITVPALIAFIAFNMLTIPCFAAVATAKAELPTKSSFRWTLLFWIAVSYIVAMMIYLIGSWWWTLFIFIAIWVGAITLIVLNNKGVINVKAFLKKLKIRRKNKPSIVCSDCSGCAYVKNCKGNDDRN